MTPIFSLRGIRKSFDGVCAVDGVCLDVQPNEFLALLGASGCGKTTLLRVMAGFEMPDAGQVVVAGADITATPAHLRPVNLMFQSYALFPHMTVAGNVAFGLKQDGLRGSELEARTTDALRMVEMESYAHRRPDQLSGGQQQRVALARCIAKQPKVVLLDEPMAALDRGLRERTRFELKALRERLGISFVVVTHDQEDAMTMADRVAVMDRGQILQLAAPREVYDRPVNRFVAGFFGESNIWDGVVTQGGDAITCPTLGATLRAQGSLPPSGSAVAVMIRPERLDFSSTIPAANALGNLVVEDVIYLGAMSTYRLRATNGATVRVTRPTIGALELARGQTVAVTCAADAVIVLPS